MKKSLLRKFNFCYVLILIFTIIFSSCGKINLSPDFGSAWCGGCNFMYDTSRIYVYNNTFSPNNLKIKVGLAITWSSSDGYSHNLISTSDPNLKAVIPSYAEIKYIPSVTGIINYHCSIHSETGTITVIP